jgi:hypothetical protein
VSCAGNKQEEVESQGAKRADSIGRVKEIIALGAGLRDDLAALRVDVGFGWQMTELGGESRNFGGIRAANQPRVMRIDMEKLR